MSGDRRRMQRCALCGRTRLSPDTPGNGAVGPRPGARSPAPDAYEAFWRTVVLRYPVVGLPRAAEEAAQVAKVRAWTRSRWLRSPRVDCVPRLDGVPLAQVRLLEAALHVWSGQVPLPRSVGLDKWRRLRGYLWFEFDEPRHLDNAPFDSPDDAAQIWQAVVRAACVAAVVRGEGIRPEVLGLVPNVADGWLGVLQTGGLANEEPGGARSPISFWLELGSGPLDNCVTAIAATRHRTVGLAGATVGLWKPMRFHLGLDEAEYSDGTLVLSVPAATRHLRDDLRDYPMILRLAETRHDGSVSGPYWWDLDEGQAAFTTLVPKLFRTG